MAVHAVSMMDLALGYARRGWRVFPLEGKVPAIKGGHGCLDATTSLDAIAELWTEYPTANIGIATGEASGILALDLDGPDARRAWTSLVGRHPAFETPTSRTGRADGGLHVLFAWPADAHVPNRPQSEWSARVLGHRKIEVIGEGRYIVAPGSTHATGARYAWELGSGDRSPACVPPWLLGLLQEELPRTERPTWQARTERDATRARAYCLGALERGHDLVVSLPPGARNNGLVKEAFSLGGYVPTGSLEPHEVREALRSACAHWGNDRDVRKDVATIERGLYAGMAEPRDIPPPQPQLQSERPAILAAPPSGSTPDLAAICKTLPGKYKRVPTTCTPLDRLCNGGLQTGRLLVLGGPPGVTKTGFALSLGYAMARRAVVAICATDEPRDGLLSRIGQMEGVSRADLDSENLDLASAAWSYVAEAVSKVPNLLIFDPREADSPREIESMIALAKARADAAGLEVVIIVDSIQTAPFASDALHEEERPRLEARMKTLQHCAVSGRMCVIAISELSRTGYREGATAGLDAFKGAGGIEYTADVACMLRRAGEAENGFFVEVAVLKNRLGEIGTIKLLRTKRCTFEPAEEPAIPDEIMDPPDIAELMDKIELALVRAKGPVSNRVDLCELVTGRHAARQAAVSRLLTERRIEKSDGRYRAVGKGPE